MSCANNLRQNNMIKYKLYSCVIELYDKFFHIENALAYIEGRDYDIIKRFIVVINMIFNINSKDEKEYQVVVDQISELNLLIEEFVEDRSNRFSDIISIVNNYNTICRNSTPYGTLTVENIDAHFDFIIKLTNAIKASFDKLGFISEVIFIEINNYLSHCATAWRKGDYKNDTGIAHLYRATLDAYKEVVLEKISQVTSNSELQDAFVRLRMEETCEVGKDIKEKIYLIDKYSNIVSEL